MSSWSTCGNRLLTNVSVPSWGREILISMSKSHLLMILFGAQCVYIHWLSHHVRKERTTGRVNMQSIFPVRCICCKRHCKWYRWRLLDKRVQDCKTTFVRNEIRLNQCKCLQLRGKTWRPWMKLCVLLLLSEVANSLHWHWWPKFSHCIFQGNACLSITTVKTSSWYYWGQLRRSWWCSYRACAITRAGLSSEPGKTCRHNWNKKPLCSNQRLFLSSSLFFFFFFFAFTD